MKCKKCNREISSPFCPYCGEKAKSKKPFYKKWWIWVILGVVSYLIFFCAIGVVLHNQSDVNVEDDTRIVDDTENSPTTTASATPTVIPSAVPTAPPDKTEEPASTKNIAVEPEIAEEPNPSKVVSSSPTAEIKPSAASIPFASKDSSGDSSNSSSKESGAEVYITENGKKYHCDPDCSNMKNPKVVSLNEAKASGRTACKKCC